MLLDIGVYVSLKADGYRAIVPSDLHTSCYDLLQCIETHGVTDTMRVRLILVVQVHIPMYYAVGSTACRPADLLGCKP